MRSRDTGEVLISRDKDRVALCINSFSTPPAVSSCRSSTSITPYIRPDEPSRFSSPDQCDVFQWGSVPYDEGARAFGFKASLRTAAKMRERLKNGPVKVRVDVQSSFYNGPDRMVIAEIPGTVKPDERIVMMAHIQEPGANDDGSGCGTLLAQWRCARRLPRACCRRQGVR